MMLNVIALQGRLVRDPELRQTQTGKQVAVFTLACDRGRKDASGKTSADFIPVIAWEARAEFVYKYFAKGQMMVVSGRMQSRTYQAKDGTNRTAIEVIAADISFCGSKADSAKAAVPAVRTSPGSSSMEDFAEIEDEGDLPF